MSNFALRCVIFAENQKRMDIKELKINPKNPRKFDKATIDKMVKSITEFPKMLSLRPIVIDDDGTVLGGNLRLKALHAAGFEEIPDDWVRKASELTEEEKKRFIIADNVQFGEWDYDELTSEWDAGQLADWGLELPTISNEVEAHEDDYEIPDEIKTDIVLGDLFEFQKDGKTLHRLLCGDSTDSDQVAKLMNGEKADMVFTDPPYLMGFKGNVHSDGSKSLNANYDDIENDKLDEAESGMFLSKIALIIKEYCNGSFYICFYRLGIEKIINALIQNGLKYRSLIIWYKNNHNLSNSDYMSIYEPIVYGWNADHNFYGNRSNFDVITMKKTKDASPQVTTQSKAIYIKSNDSFFKFEKITTKPKNYIEVKDKVVFNMFSGENNIWEVDKTQANTMHPTMKPVELCEKAIKNSTQFNGKVLDLFLGSGSTMVASHQLNRKCYGMELEPKYCQVIIDRMLKLDNGLQILKNGNPL